MKPLSQIPLLLLTTHLCLIPACKPKSTQQKIEVMEMKHSWNVPSPSPTGCKLIINEVFALDAIEWLTPQADISSKLNIYTFWKSDSPLAKLTFKKLQHVRDSQEGLNIHLISHQAPNFEIRTHSSNKSFRFGVDKSKTNTSLLAIETFPQIIITTPQGVVCWQGHPENISPETVTELISKVPE